MFTKDITKTYLVQVGYTISEIFGFSFIFLYLYLVGHSFFEIIAYNMIGFFIPILYLLFVRSFRTRTNIYISFVLGLVAYSILYTLIPSIWLYVFAMLRGIILILFYTSYNINIFGLIKKKDYAFSSGVYFSIFYSLGIFFPVIAGFIAESFGFKSLFIIGAVTLTIPAYFTSKIKNIQVNFILRNAIKNLRKINILVFIEGIWEIVPFMLIGLYTIFFIKTPLKFGLFYSYLSVVGIAANIIFTKMSDKIKKRTVFIYPLSILLGIFTMFLFYAHDFRTWAILTGIIEFLGIITFPFMTTIVLDKQKTVAEGMVVRELFLNLGRVVGISFVFLSLFLFDSLLPSFLIIGMIFLLFPYLVYRNGIYKVTT